MLQGTANYKLMAAFILFGEPTLNIIKECTEEELDNLEEFYIKEFNSVKEGFNILNTCTTRNTVRKGYMSPTSKYDEEHYLDIVLLITSNPELSNVVITYYTDTDANTVGRLKRGQAFNWLAFRHEKKYKNMEVSLSKYKDTLLEKDSSLKEVNPPAKILKTETIKPSKPIIYYPTIIDSLGNEHNIIRGFAAKFAKAHGIREDAFNKMLNGKIIQTKGWRLKI